MSRANLRALSPLRSRFMGFRRFYSINSKDNGDGNSADQTKDEKNSKDETDNNKAHLVVPRVPPTDYISAPEIQTEGLFAGYRPLFLGNSPINDKNGSTPLDNFFTSFANLKVVEESEVVGEVNVQEVIEDLRRGIPSGQMSNSKGKNRKPIIPWDASISGMVYNDDPFKHVPNNVVSKLKPFKMVRLEKKSDKNVKQPNMVKMKVHNSKVNDEPELINIFNVQPNGRRPHRHMWKSSSDKNEGTDDVAMTRQKYHEEKVQFANKHKFLRSDQRVMKQDIDKLNRLLVKELYKLTNLTVNMDFRETPLPLFIYVDKSIAAKQVLRRELKKRILDHVHPVLSMTLSAYENEEQMKRFQLRINARIRHTVRDLSEYLPSVSFTRSSVDCVISNSPIQSFKRIHWLKRRKRQNVFKGRNADLDYCFNINGAFNVTRSGVKYIRYPVYLNCESFDEAFSEWDYIG
ncbi:ZYRO0C02244p [Zygosaccharomyces rouxii]|uniref:ZYRO0C02244p n=1 Tax=Zygosaccharomyces rouxii (strain ATCC 2623 / CBS 732 / NBRC 1130 / NCYC 568 / NRRL Y-229) TaxID=559307 RepID=C5DSQ8_ZYGRC|nr:uncharacterized protein ZYRO0C02244g [Zygosaccharomyces rouxii]KAH9201991.1 hypothetical protein LQ764DRAFT_92031 [Zygosaccharomyces rouxii]CAR26819.1 ZYRO0C02244p [Zygosaccharomyces rouxii]